ncbi:hypothetical protein Tco_0422763 [Tanacetum coccineum]
MPRINRLMTLQDHPLIEYGGYALGCMTGVDMKKAAYLKMVRDELLRSMKEKRELIKNNKEMPGINRLMTLQDHPLIEYGGYALGCMTGVDMKKAAYLKMVRDELLRSMKEKRELIKNNKEM